MLGHRRANVQLANQLFSSEVAVKFIKVEEERIGLLIHELKRLKNEVKTYYEHDQLLLEETELFIKVCRRVVSTTFSYRNYFRVNNESIVKYFTITKKEIYKDLYKNNVEPIVNLIRFLRNQQNNAQMDALHRLIIEKNFNSETTFILTKQKFSDEYLEVDSKKYRIIQVKEFIRLGIFTEVVIFLGTLSYFDHKFSKLFYGSNTVFIGYSCFENRLVKSSSFSNLIGQNELINTIYKDVTFEKGYSGIDYNATFKTRNETKTEEFIINLYEKNINYLKEEKIEVKLANISNNNYIFLPIRQKVNVIDRDSLRITQVKVRELLVGDLLVFRTQNASNLVREVADTILGDKAIMYRKSLEKWKRKLRINVEKKGIEKVSRILIARYGIKVAKEYNVKNWMSSYSIKPTCLSELLEAFNFDTQEKSEIINAASEILSAHISAGHQISQVLMKELDKDLENVIDESGFYTFESTEFQGASFNIEEIRKISAQTYYIPENEILKIIKG